MGLKNISLVVLMQLIVVREEDRCPLMTPLHRSCTDDGVSISV